MCCRERRSSLLSKTPKKTSNSDSKASSKEASTGKRAGKKSKTAASTKRLKKYEPTGSQLDFLAQTSLLVEDLPLPILVLSLEDVVLYANKAALALSKTALTVGRAWEFDAKKFVLHPDVVIWNGRPAQFVHGRVADPRFVKLRLVYKRSLLELEASKHSLEQSRSRLIDAEQRAQEIEGFLDEAEINQSDLQTRLADSERKREEFEHLLALEQENATDRNEVQRALEFERDSLQEKVSGLELSLQESQATALESESRATELERFLEEAEVSQLDTEQLLEQHRTETQELREKLKEQLDQLTISRFDLNQSREQLQVATGSLQAAEARAKGASDELIRAWEQASLAEQRAVKAEKRTTELEALVEKFTPKEDDTLMEFL